MKREGGREGVGVKNGAVYKDNFLIHAMLGQGVRTKAAGNIYKRVQLPTANT